MGGVLGLTFGASILTLIELMEFSLTMLVTTCACICCSRKKPNNIVHVKQTPQDCKWAKKYSVQISYSNVSNFNFCKYIRSQLKPNMRKFYHFWVYNFVIAAKEGHYFKYCALRKKFQSSFNMFTIPISNLHNSDYLMISDMWLFWLSELNYTTISLVMHNGQWTVWQDAWSSYPEIGEVNF